MIFPIQETEASGGFLEQVSSAFSSDLFMSWEFWTVMSVILLIGEILTAGYSIGPNRDPVLKVTQRYAFSPATVTGLSSDGATKRPDIPDEKAKT